MPTVSIDKEELYTILGKDYTFDEFSLLCFEFGIELEEDTTPAEILAKEQGASKAVGVSERPILKIDIPANRYDLLCIEGLSRALSIFLGKASLPTYSVLPTLTDPNYTITIKPETASIRPYVLGAILRDVTFDKSKYDSFIELQDKLHTNLCRKRTLVAIGTHDLDTIQGPFTYEALAPKDINFIPLNQKQSMDGEQLMNFYEKDTHISKFLHIIRDSPVYPVIYDANRTVLSLPPIINGDHSKIKLTTKNIFFDVTATDLTKGKVTLNTLIAMFSQYCSKPFTVEPVQVINADGTKVMYPQMEDKRLEASVKYINSAAGIDISADQMVQNLQRMSLKAQVKPTDPDTLVVDVPPTRSDILHQCDIMEDVAIAYGFNNIQKTLPKLTTQGEALPINKLTDKLRLELAFSGFTEVLSLILCSHDENFKFLNREDQGEAVQLSNPKTVEYQVVRTSLLPGLLKTLQSNKKYALPQKLFEVQDVAFVDYEMERNSRNQRNVAAVYCNKSSGFEVVHGVLDRLMQVLNIPVVSKHSNQYGYFILPSNSPTYFQGRSATVHFNVNNATVQVGEFGILHPTVLNNFELNYVVTALELNLEPFL